MHAYLLGRPAEPCEIASAALFLMARDHASKFLHLFGERPVGPTKEKPSGRCIDSELGYDLESRRDSSFLHL